MLAFTTGTINEPDAGSVGTSMVEEFRDDLVAHAAWELVEEFTPSAGTARHYVFKCLGSQNGHGIDFFAVISRMLGNGELRFSVCEEYNAATHTMKYFPLEYVADYTFDAYGRYQGTYVLGTDTLPNNGDPTGPSMANWRPSGTSAKYWFVVDDDGFTAGFGGASVGFVHVGGYTYLGQLTNDLPLQIMGAWQNYGHIARNPAIAGQPISSAYPNAMKFVGGGGGNPATAPNLGFMGSWAHNDKLQNDQRPVSEVGMKMYGSDYGMASNYAEIYGFALGKQKRMRISTSSWPAGIAFGDAFALNGTLWVPYNPTTDDGRIWDTGVAS